MPESTASKTCTTCQSEKPLDQFNKQAKSPDGHHYYCRECQRATRSKYERSKVTSKTTRDTSAWRAANKERIRDYKAAYRSENRDKIKAYDDIYYSLNAEKLRAEGTERAKNWREGNPDKVRIKDGRRRAMKLAAFVEDVDLSVVPLTSTHPLPTHTRCPNLWNTSSPWRVAGLIAMKTARLVICAAIFPRASSP